MMRLAITPTRIDLLRDVAGGHVARADGLDINLRTGGRVGTWIGDLATGGWVALDLTPSGNGMRYWRPTALGRGYLSVRVLDYGTHAAAESGPQADPTWIGEMRPLEGMPGRYRITVGAADWVVRGRPAALAELRHRAADAYAAMEADRAAEEAIAVLGGRVVEADRLLATAVLTPDDPSLPGDGA